MAGVGVSSQVGQPTERQPPDGQAAGRSLLESPGLEVPTDDPVPRVVPRVIVTLADLFERSKRPSSLIRQRRGTGLGRSARLDRGLAPQ